MLSNRIAVEVKLVAHPVGFIGSTIQLALKTFTPATSVLWTHDIQEAVQTTSNSAIIPLDSQGNATASIIIDTTWGPGLHLLFAKDILTRYTASTQLQITGSAT